MHSIPVGDQINLVVTNLTATYETASLVLFEAASGGLKKNILFRTRYLNGAFWYPRINPGVSKKVSKV